MVHSLPLSIDDTDESARCRAAALALIADPIAGALVRVAWGLDPNASPDVVRHVRREMAEIIDEGGLVADALIVAPLILCRDDSEGER